MRTDGIFYIVSVLPYTIIWPQKAYITAWLREVAHSKFNWGTHKPSKEFTTQNYLNRLKTKVQKSDCGNLWQLTQKNSTNHKH